MYNISTNSHGDGMGKKKKKILFLQLCGGNSLDLSKHGRKATPKKQKSNCNGLLCAYDGSK